MSLSTTVVVADIWAMGHWCRDNGGHKWPCCFPLPGSCKKWMLSGGSVRISICTMDIFSGKSLALSVSKAVDALNSDSEKCKFMLWTWLYILCKLVLQTKCVAFTNDFLKYIYLCSNINRVMFGYQHQHRRGNVNMYLTKQHINVYFMTTDWYNIIYY